MPISYKDWIAGMRRIQGEFKRFQESIVRDDMFPDSDDFNEMLAYLKRNNRSHHFISIYVRSYRQYRSRVINAEPKDQENKYAIRTDRIRRDRKNKIVNCRAAQDRHAKINAGGKNVSYNKRKGADKS